MSSSTKSFPFTLMSLIFGLAICFQSLNGYSQPTYQEEGTVLESTIFSPYIKTVQFGIYGKELSQPTVSMNGKLALSFDDLVENYETYKYTIFQCNRDWTKNEDLTELDYLKGYTEGEIQDYDFSVNTLQSYVHYTLTLPSTDMRWTISGNFILKVYMDGDPDHPVFIQRFRVVESSPIAIQDLSVTRDNNPENYRTCQKVNFAIDLNGYKMPYPNRDLDVYIQQNNRWDNMKDLKPFSVSGDLISYDYLDGKTVFNGDNAFYNFDTKSLKYNSEYIDRIVNNTQGYQVYLIPNKRIVNGSYIIRGDIGGDYKIDALDVVDNVNLEAEYVFVHFFLSYDAPVAEGDIYLLGELTEYRFDENSKMTYNYGLHGYEKTLYLKQGFYDYTYAVVNDGSTVGNCATVCGNYWETDNIYSLTAYYREPGGQYDRIVSHKTIDAHDDN